MKELQKLHKAIEKVCKAFADKQGISFYDNDFSWGFFEDGLIVFGIGDIVEDLEENRRAGLILEWHQFSVERSMKGKSYINYTSYVMGLRDY